MNWLSTEEAAMVLMDRRSGELGAEETAAVRLLTAQYDDSVTLLNFFTRFRQNDIGRGYHVQVIAGVAREGVIWLPVRAARASQVVNTDRYDSWHEVSLNLHEVLLEPGVGDESIGFDSVTGIPMQFGGAVYGYEFMLAISGVAYNGEWAAYQEPDNDLYVRAVDFLNSY